MLWNVKEDITEYARTDRSVMFLKFWHDFCNSYYVKIFTTTVTSQFNKSNQVITIMANRKSNDFFNMAMEIVYNAVRKTLSITDKFFRTKKTTRKWMSITFISLFIFESFYPLGRIVKGAVGNFIGGASGMMIFILGSIATCYIIVDMIDPTINNENKK